MGGRRASERVEVQAEVGRDWAPADHHAGNRAAAAAGLRRGWTGPHRGRLPVIGELAIAVVHGYDDPRVLRLNGRHRPLDLVDAQRGAQRVAAGALHQRHLGFCGGGDGGGGGRVGARGGYRGHSWRRVGVQGGDPGGGFKSHVPALAAPAALPSMRLATHAARPAPPASRSAPWVPPTWPHSRGERLPVDAAAGRQVKLAVGHSKVGQAADAGRATQPNHFFKSVVRAACHRQQLVARPAGGRAGRGGSG